LHSGAMKKVRIPLAIFSAVLTAALGVFIWIMLDAASNAMSSVLLRSLLLIVGVTILAQIIYALKGQIFEFDGRLAKAEVLFSIICFQLVMQFSFGFSLYAVNQTELQNAGFDSAYAHFIKLQQQTSGNTLADYEKLDLEAGMPENIERVFLAGSDSAEVFNPRLYYRFPVSGGSVLMSRSQQYDTRHLQDFALSLLMSLVVSVLLMAELALLAIKFIGRRDAAERDAQTASGPVGYLRQLAFLFYFTGFLGASFIPIMARGLVGENPAADFIAGLPYSVEAFANCVAILVTARIFRKRGWKPPYLMGVGIFIAGLAASALSPNVFAFIASRAAVGLGYGLCWMTLRNVATLSDNRAAGFADLSSGIYAGIMCGVAFGAVLADSVGFRTVLFISAAIALVAAAFPLMLHNSAGKGGMPAAAQGKDLKLNLRDLGAFAVFLLAIVIPVCIADAFNGYLVPLYVNHLALPTAYIGRVTLVYNLCLVYLSSTLLLRIICRYIKNSLLQNILHVIGISLALLLVAHWGGFMSVLVAGALLGSVDGFGSSVQNAYVLDTRLARKLGVTRMLTLFSLFKKFSAMLAPFALGLFILRGFSGLGILAAVFFICAVVGAIPITLMHKKGVSE